MFQSPQRRMRRVITSSPAETEMRLASIRKRLEEEQDMRACAASSTSSTYNRSTILYNHEHISDGEEINENAVPTHNTVNVAHQQQYPTQVTNIDGMPSKFDNSRFAHRAHEFTVNSHGSSPDADQPPENGVHPAASHDRDELKLQFSTISSKRDLSHYVGFAALPDQIYRRAVKNGFDFNLMVVGAPGLGKSTLANTLFLTDIYNEEHPGPSLRSSDTVQVDSQELVLSEGPVRLRLTVSDCPGFADAVDNSGCWQPIIDHIDTQFAAYLTNESMVDRATSRPDTRVHCCLYFISPSGHGMTPLDVQVMRHLHQKVNILPLIAKADTMTKDECSSMKKTILKQISDNDIQIYQFPPSDEDIHNYKDLVPFAVVGSDAVIEIDGKNHRARQYPWGIVQVDNIGHNDFCALRDMLIRTHLIDLIDVTNNVHYENYRVQKLAPSDPASGVPMDKSPLTQIEEERRNHSMKLKKMQAEMEAVFEMKVKEKQQKLQQSEQELEKREEQMRLSLENQRNELNEKREKFEREKHGLEQMMKQYKGVKIETAYKETMEKGKKGKKLF